MLYIILDDVSTLLQRHFCGFTDSCPVESSSEEPKFPQYSTAEARLKTYKGLQKKLPVKRKVFAEAGFMYMGVDDHVQCFYCGGTLKDWKKGLDPFYEHAGWYGNCLFIKAIKGQEFVNSCSKTNDSFVPYVSQSYPV